MLDFRNNGWYGSVAQLAELAYRDEEFVKAGLDHFRKLGALAQVNRKGRRCWVMVDPDAPPAPKTSTPPPQRRHKEPRSLLISRIPDSAIRTYALFAGFSGPDGCFMLDVNVAERLEVSRKEVHSTVRVLQDQRVVTAVKAGRRRGWSVNAFDDADGYALVGNRAVEQIVPARHYRAYALACMYTKRQVPVTAKRIAQHLFKEGRKGTKQGPGLRPVSVATARSILDDLEAATWLTSRTRGREKLFIAQAWGERIDRGGLVEARKERISSRRPAPAPVLDPAREEELRSLVEDMNALEPDLTLAEREQLELEELQEMDLELEAARRRALGLVDEVAPQEEAGQLELFGLEALEPAAGPVDEVEQGPVQLELIPSGVIHNSSKRGDTVDPLQGVDTSKRGYNHTSKRGDTTHRNGVTQRGKGLSVSGERREEAGPVVADLQLVGGEDHFSEVEDMRASGDLRLEPGGQAGSDEGSHGPGHAGRTEIDAGPAPQVPGPRPPVPLERGAAETRRRAAAILAELGVESA